MNSITWAMLTVMKRCVSSKDPVYHGDFHAHYQIRVKIPIKLTKSFTGAAESSENPGMDPFTQTHAHIPSHAFSWPLTHTDVHGRPLAVVCLYLVPTVTGTGESQACTYTASCVHHLFENDNLFYLCKLLPTRLVGLPNCFLVSLWFNLIN